VTEEEREDILRLLASCDDMTRAIMTLVRLVHAAPNLELNNRDASIVAEVAAGPAVRCLPRHRAPAVLGALDRSP
jgi:hypothetical protein